MTPIWMPMSDAAIFGHILLTVIFGTIFTLTVWSAGLRVAMLTWVGAISLTALIAWALFLIGQ